MTRLLSPADGCVGVDVPFGRGRSYDGRVIDVTDPGHVRALRSAGYTVAATAGAPARADGFVCSACQFHSYFRVCGRCGEKCDKTAG